jgi:peptidoglycan/LPS O-acetylase OafA/YrhL
MSETPLAKANSPAPQPPAGSVPAAGGHLPVLDGVRGLAILLVLVIHSIDYGWKPDSAGEQVAWNLARWGWVGVDLFFVLSGFLITGILLRTRREDHYLRNFYARRALRIFPLYYGTVFLCLVLLPRIPLPALDWLRDLATRQGWFWAHASNYYKITVTDGPVMGWLSSMWSLAVEEHFYFVWPFVVYWVSPRRLAGVCLGGALLVLALRVGLATAGFSGDYLYRSTLTRIDPLLLGALLAVLTQSASNRAWLVKLARGVLAVTAGVFVLQMVALHGAHGRDTTWFGKTGLYSMAGLFFAALLVLVLYAPPQSRLQRFFSLGTLQTFGKYSYAMYILNKPVFYLVKSVFSPADYPVFGSQLPGAVLFLGLGTLLTLGGALVSWNLLEKRFLSLKRYFEAGKPKRVRPVVVPSAAPVAGRRGVTQVPA